MSFLAKTCVRDMLDLLIYLEASPMPLALRWLVVSLICFSSFSAESYAGSLVSGCTFDVTCFMLSVLVPEALACLLRPLWLLGAPSSDPGGLGAQRGRPWGPGSDFF